MSDIQTPQTIKKPLDLLTLDNVGIRAYHYQPNSESSEDPTGIIVIGSATGVPQGFYKRFAEAAVSQGFEVITLDYRGIGESAPATLKGYHMDYLDWARQDLAAGIEYAQTERRTRQLSCRLIMVGHSYGGHALGLLPNIEHIDGAYIFGAGAGWHGWMPALERFKVRLLWNVIAPIVVKLNGYLAWNSFGMGENLPLNVYRQWKHWCKFPHYFFDDPKMQHMHEVFARYDKPLVAVNAIDDKWAQPASRDAFFKGYKNAQITNIDLQPSDCGLQKVDHMGYFKRDATAIWDEVFAWAKTLR
ncbi:alpha/beta hydrolase family protein [Brumicola blandensis]|uniref:Alpha/beta fold hydrolase n=1 Tax=Brumicola blandensis TaxID=3075611 RepID=A0AAW8R5Q9_9ALTE|nr:alpha/beta fold hydrolase [Alteromonas sp. W409]MDT0583762.1 alpha/beta fold hydrolase [Alteromonas sp. W409]